MDFKSPDARFFRLALESFIGAGKPYNQSTLAMASGVGRSVINEVLRCKKLAGRAAQEKIARACGLTLTDFLALGQAIEREENQSSAPPPRAPLKGAKASKPKATKLKISLADELLAAQREIIALTKRLSAISEENILLKARLAQLTGQGIDEARPSAGPTDKIISRIEDRIEELMRHELKDQD